MLHSYSTQAAEHSDDTTLRNPHFGETTNQDKTSVDFSIYKNSHYSQVIDKNEHRLQQSAFEKENLRNTDETNDEWDSSKRQPLQAPGICRPLDYSNTNEDTFFLPSNSKCTQLNDQVSLFSKKKQLFLKPYKLVL
jgi:hypothetical protein